MVFKDGLVHSSVGNDGNRDVRQTGGLEMSEE